MESRAVEVGLEESIDWSELEWINGAHDGAIHVFSDQSGAALERTDFS